MKLKLIALSAIIVTSNLAFAQNTGTIYRYKDDRGNLIYSDRLPKNIKNQIEVLSSTTGTLKKVIERQLTIEEIEAMKQKEAQNQQNTQKMLQQERQDQLLLATYSSSNDIDNMKNFELSQIRRAIENDKNNLQALREKLDFIEAEMKKNPKETAYNSERNRITQNIVSISTSLTKNEEMLLDREQKYNNDKKRFEELMSTMNARGENSNTSNQNPSN